MTSTNQSKKHSEQLVQDSIAKNYEQLRYKLPYSAIYHEWWLEEMVKIAPVSSNNTEGRFILDNGCGTGLLLNALRQQSASILGLDLSYGMLKRAYKPKRKLIQGDSCQMPFPDNQFDLIFARALIHHLPNPEKGLSEMNRVLKSQGHIVLADTNHSWLSSLPRRIAYKSENFSDHHVNLHHQVYLDWIKNYFSIQQVRFFGYLAYPFGFPDMMGKFRNVPYPVSLVRLLIEVDKLISHIPLFNKQSWGIMVSAKKD